MAASRRAWTPKFGEPVENTYASLSNPTRVGLFVKSGRRTGRLNPGVYWTLTDGRGKFWDMSPDNCRRPVDDGYMGPLADAPAPVPDDAERRIEYVVNADMLQQALQAGRECLVVSGDTAIQAALDCLVYHARRQEMASGPQRCDPCGMIHDGPRCACGEHLYLKGARWQHVHTYSGIDSHIPQPAD